LGFRELPPQTPLGELTAFSQTPSWIKGGLLLSGRRGRGREAKEGPKGRERKGKRERKERGKGRARRGQGRHIA